MSASDFASDAACQGVPVFLEMKSGVLAIVDVEVRGDGLHHSPKRITKQARRLEDAKLVQVMSSKLTSIALEQFDVLLFGVTAIDREPREIEQGVPHSRIFPIDDPDALAIVEDIGGQHVVVAKRRNVRSDRARKLARRFEHLVDVGGELGSQSPRRCHIGATGLKRGEKEQLADQPVPPFVQLPKDSGKPGREPWFPCAARVEGTARYVTTDEHAILAVDKRRRDAQRLGSAMTLQLVSAINAQNEQLLADASDKLLVRVADELVPVGDPALEGSKLDWAGPKRERANAVGVDVVGAIHFVGSFLATRGKGPGALDFAIGR